MSEKKPLSQETKEKLAEMANIDIEALSDEALEDVAGGCAANSCSSSGCSNSHIN